MRRKRLKNKKIFDKQNLFNRSLEGMGDVLVFETKRQKNKLVLDGLQKIRNLIKKLFEMQMHDPDRFEQLIFSQDFLELYRKNEDEAKVHLFFDTEKCLVSFSTAINQIIRVYQTAVDSQNEEVGRFAVQHIIWILSELSKTPNNGLFVESILRKLAEITKIAIEHNDESMYIAGTRWYTSIIFDSLRDNQSEFDLTYLELFDKYFFSTIQYIVSNDHFSTYKEIITNLIDNLYICPAHAPGEIWTYGHLILQENFDKYRQLNEQHNVEKNLGELDSLIGEIDTIIKLHAWIDKFNAFKETIKNSFTKEQEKKADKLEKQIKNFVVSKFKYNNLLKIVFIIGVYCLFKQKPSYIKYLWEYKQPPDSDAIWVGHEIIPQNLDEVVKLYFKIKNSQESYSFREGHHGGKKYHKEYFLLLLAHVLKNIHMGSECEFNKIENYRLPELNIYFLNDLNITIDSFIELASELKNKRNLLVELGFNLDQLDEVFEKKLIAFLNKLKEDVSKKILVKHKLGHISQKKIDDFKQEVLKSFYKSADIRDIFINYLKSYDNQLKGKNECETEHFGIEVIVDKACFFDEWYINFGDLGESYGRDLALGESSFFLNELVQNCRTITSEEFDDILKNADIIDESVILAVNAHPILFFKDSANFKSKAQITNYLNIKSFEGFYILHGQSIPVFEVYSADKGRYFLIVNKKSFGQLVQSSPLSKGEDEQLVIDIFYMDVQEVMQNRGLGEQFLKQPPEWLQKVGDEKEQHEHLKTRAYVQILEKFEFRKSHNFKGYKFSLGD